MRRLLRVALTAVLCLGFGVVFMQAQAAPAPDKERAEEAALPSVEPGPKVVVDRFLNSLRKGDRVTAESLLSDRARIETEKANLKVAPPGTPKARYKVGEVKYSNDTRDVAQVASVWDDTYADGSTEKYNVTWVLRKQKDGWRIRGLTVKPQPGAAMGIFLDFEHPRDMLRKVEQANAKVE